MPNKKICLKCGIKKTLNCFHNLNIKYKDKTYRYKRNYCISCSAKNCAQWKKENPDKARACREKWKLKYPEKDKRIKKRWKRNNPQKVYEQNRRATIKFRSTLKGNLTYRIGCSVRNSLQKNKSGYRWEKILGFTLEDLKKHLESRFTSGMSWDLFMQGKIHIDHIIPISQFRFNKSEDSEFKIGWELKNLQPLWAKDNWSKHNKTMEEWGRSKLTPPARGKGELK